MRAPMNKMGGIGGFFQTFTVSGMNVNPMALKKFTGKVR